MAVVFEASTSPIVGREGDIVGARQLKERLMREKGEQYLHAHRGDGGPFRRARCRPRCSSSVGSYGDHAS